MIAKKRRGRGRPRVDSEEVRVRLRRSELEALDVYIERAMRGATRLQAVRALVGVLREAIAADDAQRPAAVKLPSLSELIGRAILDRMQAR